MINLFQSAVDPEVFGFTQDATGENLPAKFAPWRKSSQGGSLYLGIGESSAELGSVDPVIRAVQTQGFYLVERNPAGGSVEAAMAPPVHAGRRGLVMATPIGVSAGARREPQRRPRRPLLTPYQLNAIPPDSATVWPVM